MNECERFSVLHPVLRDTFRTQIGDYGNYDSYRNRLLPSAPLVSLTTCMAEPRVLPLTLCGTVDLSLGMPALHQ